MIGEQKADSGVIDIGETVALGVYEQNGIPIDDPEQTVLEFVLEHVRASPDSSTDASNDARKLLRQFEFDKRVSEGGVSSSLGSCLIPHVVALE